jgi:Derlin-2/3
LSQKLRSIILNIRGGKKDKKEKEEEEEPDEDEVNDDDFDEPDEIATKPQFMTSITDAFTKTPPMTQGYISASVFLTFLLFVVNKNVWPDILNLDWSKVLTRLEIWRPFTAFLFFGNFGLNYLLTIQFVWTYMAQLEKMNYKNPEEFFVMLAFGAASLLVLYPMFGLSPKFLGHNLSTYLVYIWARVFEGVDVSVMDLFLIKSELLPWFFVAQTAVLEGEFPFADLLGIVVGHFYHYLTKKKVLKAPEFVKAWFSSEAMKQKYAKFKDDFDL